MSLINLGGGLSAMGGAVSAFAGNAAMAQQKADLEKQQLALADHLATTREHIGRVEAGDIAATAAGKEHEFQTGLVGVKGTQDIATAKAVNELPMTAAQKASNDVQRGTLAETAREHDITAKQARIKFEKDAMGNVLPFDTETQKFVKPADIGLPENMSQENAAETARQIYEYRKKPLSGFVMKSPYGQMVQDEINKLDTDGQKGGGQPYNEQFYATSQKARNDFGTGKQGDKVRSANVWAHHLMMLKGLGEAMDNGDSQTITKIKQQFQTEFNNPGLASYDAIAPLVAEEGANFIMAGNSSAPEREEFKKPLVSARNTEARNVALNTLLGAAGAQLHGLKQQYKFNVRSNDFEGMLDPEVSKLISDATPGASPSPAAPADAKAVPAPGAYTWTPQGLVPKK